MIPAAPSISGVLSVLSKSIHVRGQFPGGEVEIFRNGSSIGRRTANGFDEVYDFDAGVTLDADDEITVAQTFNGETGPRTPIPTLVQGLIAPFEGQRFISHIYQCGTSLFFNGVVPGATLQVKNQSGTVIGSAVSVDGTANVVLQSSIGNSERVSARQLVNGGAGGTVFSAPADPFPTILKPNVETPRACMTAVLLHGIVDGAEIDVQTRAGDPSSTLSYKTSLSEWFISVPALTAGQKIRFQEKLPHCKQFGDPQDFVVKPMSFANNPTVDGPLCANSVGLKVHGVTRGAELVAQQGGTVLGTMIAFDTDVDFWVMPLLATGEDLTVTQSLCGVSSTSDPVPVEANPAQPTPCDILEPLNNCALTVWVQNGRPGAMTAVFSDQKGQISAWQALPEDGKINLSSALQAGHRITVIQNACGFNRVKSNNEPEVQATPNLASPTIAQPVFADLPTIVVEGCATGALVDVYTEEGGFLHSAIADADGRVEVSHSTAFLTVPPDWHVYARQSLCALVSEPGPSVPVVDRTPRTPIINMPGIGQQNVELRPRLVWTDPGKNTVHQAERFLVQVTTPEHPLYDAVAFKTVVNATSTNPTTVTVDHDLVAGQRYIWQIIPALGNSGAELTGQSSNGSFVIKAAAAAPGRPALSSLTHGTTALHYVLKGSSFLPSAAVHLRITAPSLMGEFVNTDAAGHPIKSDANGALNVEVALPNLATGINRLFFQANDGRPDPSDIVTNTLWSNVLDIDR